MVESLAHAAIRYAENGWRVHPLHHIRDGGRCSCGGDRCKVGKHPRLSNWQSKATTDAATIRAWWAKYPSANIGIVCDALTVIDVDPKNGGSLAEAFDTYPDLKSVFATAHTIQTGDRSGYGRHYYFNGSGALTKALKGTSGLGAGVDVLTGKNYVVAPPSNHAHGTRYKYIGGTLSDIPPILDNVINAPSNDPALDTSGDIPEGSRNDALTSIAGKISRTISKAATTKQRLHEINRIRCNPPMSFDEVEKIVGSVIKMAKSGSNKVSPKTRWQIEVTRTNLPDKMMIVLFELSHHAGATGGSCFPSQQTVANNTGISRVTVNKYLNRAVELGYVKRWERSKSGFRIEYSYQLTLPPLN